MKPIKKLANQNYEFSFCFTFDDYLMEIVKRSIDFEDLPMNIQLDIIEQYLMDKRCDPFLTFEDISTVSVVDFLRGTLGANEFSSEIKKKLIRMFSSEIIDHILHMERTYIEDIKFAYKELAHG